MKMIVLLTLFITVGCILAAGCIGQTNKDTLPEKCVCPACPGLTNTTVPNPNVTVPATSGVNGTLEVSVGSWDDMSLFIDNKRAGNMTKNTPSILKLEEGNHTVKVCSGDKCLTEEVEIKFAKIRVLDFTEQLIKDWGSPNPTARILQFSRSSDGVLVVVEFINPTTKYVSIDTEVSVVYSFTEPRTNQRVIEIARGIAFENVKAQQRTIINVYLDFVSGYSYTYESPTLGQINVRQIFVT